MITVACGLYGTFLTTAISLLLGITIMILQIVFNYIGFLTNDFTTSTCLDTYLIWKYSHLQLQIQVAFITTIIALAFLIIILVLITLTAKNYRAFTSNPQNRHQYLFLPDILSKPKYVALYILASFGTLGNLLCFGLYLTFFIQSQKDTNVCAFSYNYTNLLVLVILTGIWLLSFIVLDVFLLVTRGFLQQDEEKQQKINKYKQMINVTQQPGRLTTKQNERNYQQYTQQQFDNQAHSFGNKQNQDPYRRNNQSILNSKDSFGQNNDKQKKQTFQQYRERQKRQYEQKKKKDNPNYYQHENHNQPFKNPLYEQEPTPKNNDALKYYQNQKPNKFYIDSFDKNPPTVNKKSHHRADTFGKQSPSNNNNRPYSPIKILGDNVNQPSRSNGSLGSPYNQELKSPYNKSPQRRQNNNSYRPEQSFRGPQEDTRGQLVFFKKPLEKSRREDTDRNDQMRDNDSYDNYSININNRNNKAPYSSGEVSFKSPSRFESKFAQQQNDYLRRNIPNSILPSNNIREVTGGSRKIAIDDKYSSGGLQSNFGQSRNLESSPNQSRTKGREGVLTSYIRGKFS